MKKVLRSLIHEKFPIELRVKLDLLSRDRSLINKEKQDELMKLLREFNINDITPLGPGTNRYAFRMEGFVIKVATDNDGKIDNLKEYKMSPLLQPYVTRTYEVAENGTLLVAEYIQPFQAYAEMLKYADQIRAILKKLSSVYLLGDVGVAAKNYANWGLRIGRDEEPVCLDFAYVFDTSSDLFVCQACNTNSMLVPNSDFTSLICQNPACGKRYTFEEVRMRISNEAHKKEIGDLSESGYVMTGSNVETELIPAKSPYLHVKKVTKHKPDKEEPQEPVVLDNFVYNEKEDTEMNENEMASKYCDNELIVKARVIVPAEEEDEGVLAFSGEIEEQPVTVEDDLSIPEDVLVEKIEKVPQVVEPQPEPESKTDQVVPTNATTPMFDDDHVDPDNIFTHEFIKNLSRAISKVSNKIGDDLYQREVYELVLNDLMKKKEFKEPFYTSVQNAVFRSLVEFCGLVECSMPNDKTPGTHRDWVLDKGVPKKAVDTLKFIERFWHIKSINRLDNAVEIMNRYKSQFSDYLGISPEWKELFINRLLKKYAITPAGAIKVADAIAEVWCDEDDDDDHGYDEEDDIETKAKFTEENEDDGDLAFSGEIIEEVDETEDDFFDDDELDGIHVEVYPQSKKILICGSDIDSEIRVPIYHSLDEVNIEEDGEGKYIMGSDLNGNYEWLVHFTPDMMFSTNNPKKWMDKYNYSDSPIRLVILDNEDDNRIIMGLYRYDGIYLVDGEEVDEMPEETALAKINALVCREISMSDISYFERALAATDRIRNESDIEEIEAFAASAQEEDLGPLTETEKAVLDALRDAVDVEEAVDEVVDEAVEDVLEEHIDEVPTEEPNEAPLNFDELEKHLTFKPIRRSDV